MAVLIRRVAYESLFSFRGQRKVLSCKIYRRGLVSFTANRSARPFLNRDQVSNLFKGFSGNLHFTHYARGKYVIQGSYPFLKKKFKDFSRTFKDTFLIFQGL